MDGANMNALFGRVSIHELGADALHLNIHKSFAAPHGGGGPGAGPVLFSERLTKYVSYPIITKDGSLIEKNPGESLGRVKSWHGQFLVLLRALAFIMAHGGDGLKQSAADAVMNANYMRVQLRDVVDAYCPDRICMHEVLFTDKKFTENGFSTMDVAKGMLDAGFHPPTVYFPLVVSGAMLFEPTENESKEDLDKMIEAVKKIVKESKADPKHANIGPYACPVGRPDETRAARQPILKA
jgi:glycine dehydrogenase subunit 2